MWPTRGFGFYIQCNNLFTLCLLILSFGFLDLAFKTGPSSCFMSNELLSWKSAVCCSPLASWGWGSLDSRFYQCHARKEREPGLHTAWPHRYLPCGESMAVFPWASAPSDIWVGIWDIKGERKSLARMPEQKNSKGPPNRMSRRGSHEVNYSQ